MWREAAFDYIFGRDMANSTAHISTGVILREVSTLDQPLFPMMLCKATEAQVDCSRTSAYHCLQGQTLKTTSLWLEAYLGTEEGEANMEKSQRKGKVSDGHNVQLAVLMAGKRNRWRGARTEPKTEFLLPYQPQQLYPKLLPRDPTFSKSM